MSRWFNATNDDRRAKYAMAIEAGCPSSFARKIRDFRWPYFQGAVANYVAVFIEKKFEHYHKEG